MSTSIWNLLKFPLKFELQFKFLLKFEHQFKFLITNFKCPMHFEFHLRFEFQLRFKFLLKCELQLIFRFHLKFVYTSHCLIVCPKVALDSEVARQDMKKITIGSKSPTNAHLISKIFRIYTYPPMKKSTIFDSHTIIELHIFWYLFHI